MSTEPQPRRSVSRAAETRKGLGDISNTMRFVARLDEQRGLTDEVMAERRRQDDIEETARRVADERLQRKLIDQDRKKLAAARKKKKFAPRP